MVQYSKVWIRIYNIPTDFGLTQGGTCMNPIGRISVSTIVPDGLSGLLDLSKNYWWTWNYEVLELYKSIDPSLWEEAGANPVAFLRRVSKKALANLQTDTDFMKRYTYVMNKYNDYISRTDTWFNGNYPDFKSNSVAYFSAEYGLNENLPIYSGGLGVLSGDHCKSASDLGIPFTAIGIFYKQGYFNQHINSEGIQDTEYTTLPIENLGIDPVTDSKGDKLLIQVEFPGRTVYAALWLARVGRVNLYLLDSDVPQNTELDRSITARLYGGGTETRIQQEILLGIGGVRALKALGLEPSVYHVNEGHSAFLAFELIRVYMQEYHLNFKEACKAVSSSLIFTTHTPVPAGIDVFPHTLMDIYFSSFWERLGISRDEFLALGLDYNNPCGFNMAVLAMNLSSHINGVSKLHGEVTSKMFNNLWQGVPQDEVPVTHVTNGIHTLSWLSAPYKRLFDAYLPEGWERNLSDAKVWDSIDNIPDELLWRKHLDLKSDLFKYIYNSTATDSCRVTSPDILTIAFSRRFATYKRAALIFRNINRIKKLLNIDGMPLQIIFAGKAHPRDVPAQDVIKQINDIAKQEGFAGKVFLLENYNIALARRLVQGADVWLNNPRRPLEASGTSGQKACINGVLNLSILDGWWPEGYNGKNGWAIGIEKSYENDYLQDNADSESLYNVLENSIIPLYYNRDEKGIPTGWVKMMKESIKSLTACFSTNRMVQDYALKLYIPSIMRVNTYNADNFKIVRQLTDWEQTVRSKWYKVSITGNKPGTASGNISVLSGEEISLEATVDLGGLKPEDVAVELYFGQLDSSGQFQHGSHIPMHIVDEITPGIYKYRGYVTFEDGLEYGYNFRVLPVSKYYSDKFELRLVKWADGFNNN
jgi:starch phosphorylase